MEKTKLGIKANWLAAIIFVMAFFGWYVPVILAIGYVLIAESGIWLKKMSVKCLVIMLLFMILSKLVSIIPDWTLGFANYGSILYQITYYTNKVIDILLYSAEIAVYVLMVIFSLKSKTIRIPLVDNILDKCYDASANN